MIFVVLDEISMILAHAMRARANQHDTIVILLKINEISKQLISTGENGHYARGKQNKMQDYIVCVLYLHYMCTVFAFSF